MMKIGAAYVRVSTDDQLEYSPESQIDTIQAYAKSHDIIIPPEYIFQEDDGVSGRKVKRRHEFMRMIGIAKTKPKPFDLILVWKFNRFARNREDSVVYKSMLRKDLGIDVVSINEPLPDDDKLSILMEAFIEAMDEYYSINLGEDVRRGMIKKASRGEPVSTPPFGYDIRDKQFFPNPETAPIVQMIFQEYLAGRSTRDLALTVTNMGIRTARGGRFENRTIQYILNNPTYIGKIRYSPNGRADRDFNNPDLIISDGSHETIIDNKTWELTQAKLEESKKLYSKHSRIRDKQDFILQGLVKCSNCGATLTRGSRNSLQCNKYVHGLCAVSHYISMDLIIQAVIECIEEDFKAANFEIINKSIPSKVDMTNIYETQIARENQKLERVKFAYENGVDSLEEYKENKQKIMDAIAHLKSQQPLPPQPITTRDFIEKHKDAPKLLRDASISETEKNKLLRTFIDHIIFYRKKNHIQIIYYA